MIHVYMYLCIYTTRWRRDSEWETSHVVTDFDWKDVAEPVMELYSETTDGSFIEKKESALVWHHKDADPDFGAWQAKELLDHLESVLANDPVVVKMVEVKPQVKENTLLFRNPLVCHVRQMSHIALRILLIKEKTLYLSDIYFNLKYVFL